MKKIRMMVIATLLVAMNGLALTGCGGLVAALPPNTSIDSPDNTAQDTSVEPPVDSSTDASEEVIQEGEVVKDGNVILKQLAFVFQENTIALSDFVDDQKIEHMLGKADQINSHTYSAEDGKNMDPLNGMTEKQYDYSGLTIKTIDATVDKKSFIFSIEITDPKYPTIRNIKVGDSYERLKEAYPEGVLLGGELSDEEDDYRYEPVNYVDTMIFHIKDKKVESIRINTLLD